MSKASDLRQFFWNSTEMLFAFDKCKEEIQDILKPQEIDPTFLYPIFCEGYMHAKSKFTGVNSTWTIAE